MTDMKSTETEGTPVEDASMETTADAPQKVDAPQAASTVEPQVDPAFTRPNPTDFPDPLQGTDQFTKPTEQLPDAPQLGSDPLGPTVFTDAFGKDLKDTPGGVSMLDRYGDAPERLSTDDLLAGPGAIRPADAGGEQPDGLREGVHVGGGADPTLAVDGGTPAPGGARPLGEAILTTIQEALNRETNPNDVTDGKTKINVDGSFEKVPKPKAPTEPPEYYENPEGDAPITVDDVEGALEGNRIKHDSVTNPGRTPGDDGPSDGGDADDDIDRVKGGPHDGAIDPPQDAPSADEVLGAVDQFRAQGGYLENYGNPGEGGGDTGVRPRPTGTPPTGGGDGDAGGDGGTGPGVGGDSTIAWVGSVTPLTGMQSDFGDNPLGEDVEGEALALDDYEAPPAE